MNLTPRERRELRELLEDLTQAMDSGALWPGQLRETTRKLHTYVTAWLGDADENTETEGTPPPHHDH
ncbi:hypothetical protein FHX37_2008 [Haloactinospora alba]|uniref:Uncharacterized protein n=1 Tax=Haloactinospora alba TaxID=405555 RepID=A0A543NJV1_9ACTN|nr:hypothetical protein [Haloactinospora alba]TQN32082.1 hypothetical protein FHX37_2008 [Haloactinospora alba]